jgi:hypothetical protein
MAPVSVSVDLIELGRVRDELFRLLGTVSELPEIGDVDDARMGGDDAASAITGFRSAWRGGRDQLVQHLAACLTLVELALTGYGQVESELTAGCAAAPAVPATSTGPMASTGPMTSTGRSAP